MTADELIHILQKFDKSDVVYMEIESSLGDIYPVEVGKVKFEDGNIVLVDERAYHD